jgi:hypothetical protein
VLQVHMKPRGLDSCSYADLGIEKASNPSKSSQADDADTMDLIHSMFDVRDSGSVRRWLTIRNDVQL